MATFLSRGQTLTHKFRGPKDIFEVNACLYFVRQSKVYEFDAGQRDISVQEHDVFWLEKKMEEHIGQNTSAGSNTGRDERERVTCGSC